MVKDRLHSAQAWLRRGGGMALVLLGGLLLSGEWLFLPAIPFVAIGPLVELLRSRGRMQAQPKDASPFDTVSAEES